MNRLELYPAIDIKEGQAVRLRQGRMEEATIYNPDPAAAAQQWVEAGTRWLHVVDLDGAVQGASRNLDAVRSIAAVAKQAGVAVQLGGGLRSLADMEAALAAGVTRVIIGTSALSSDLVAQAVAHFGPERVVVGIDARGGLVATDGWLNVSTVKATDLAQRVGEAGVGTIIYTDISKDGMMAGPNFDELAVMGGTGLSIIASGGIASMADIAKVMQIPGMGGAILGKALYTGAIDLREALGLCQ